MIRLEIFFKDLENVKFDWDRLDAGYKQVIYELFNNIRNSKNLQEAKKIFDDFSFNDTVIPDLWWPRQV